MQPRWEVVPMHDSGAMVCLDLTQITHMNIVPNAGGVQENCNVTVFFVNGNYLQFNLGPAMELVRFMMDYGLWPNSVCEKLMAKLGAMKLEYAKYLTDLRSKTGLSQDITDYYQKMQNYTQRIAQAQARQDQIENARLQTAGNVRAGGLIPKDVARQLKGIFESNPGTFGITTSSEPECQVGRAQPPEPQD